MPDGHVVEPGKSILDELWDELDKQVIRNMSATAATERGRGRAEGLAVAISIMSQPYLPTLEAVRERAMERYEAHRASTSTARKPGKSKSVH